MYTGSLASFGLTGSLFAAFHAPIASLSEFFRARRIVFPSSPGACSQALLGQRFSFSRLIIILHTLLSLSLHTGTRSWIPVWIMLCKVSFCDGPKKAVVAENLEKFDRQR